jgi:GntR family transcriptional repressor for pyruvate dehydrogenase complex
VAQLSNDEGTLTLSPVPHQKLGERVAEQLLEEIRAKALAPGYKLPSERELMGQLGVGRSTVREAVNGLAMLGVVEIRHGQGAFVADPSGADGVTAIRAALARGVTRELFEARRAVEPETARLAAVRCTAEDAERIALILDAHAAALENEEPGVDMAVGFHVLIAEVAGNDILLSFVRSLADVLEARGPILEKVPGYRVWEVEQHRRVFEDIRRGDPDAAADAMRRHLDEVVVHHERIGLT